MARRAKPEQPSEVLSALVLMRTPDGYVTGRALVEAKDVEWLSPKHVRDVQETRPHDIVLKAEKVLDDEGHVQLRPKRVAKGTPVLETVGKQVVFGEMLEAATLRARTELKAMVFSLSRNRTPFWQHLCAEAQHEPSKLPLKLSSPKGRPCAACGETEESLAEKAKKARAV